MRVVFGDRFDLRAPGLEGDALIEFMALPSTCASGPMGWASRW